MKKISFAIIGVACFVGVFGALQLDRLMNRRPDEPSIQIGSTNARIIPASASTEEAGIAAPDFRVAAKKVIPSVVSVDQFRRLNSFFSDETVTQQTGTGSGVVISKDGIIVTNNHVVQLPNGRVADAVQVRLSDKRTVSAEVVGRDPRSDIAVLRVKATGLTPIEIGDSSKLDIGEWVLAVGNPLGFDNTVSVGVVSSLKRSLPIQGSFLTDSIQTDAAINQGNSGGALANAQGQLVGINSAIASTTGGSIGIGFAVPVNRVQQVVSDILKFGYVKYASLGIRSQPGYDGILARPDAREQLAEITSAKNPPSSGILIGDGAVVPGSAADQIGMKPYDVMLRLDDRKTDDWLTVIQILNAKRPGDRVKVEYWSRGEVKSAMVTLQEIGRV